MPSKAKSQRKPICVVLDANQWRNSHLLRTPMGSAIRYFINFADAKLGLPEVVETELNKHLLKVGTDAVSSIKSHFEIVKALMGSHKPYEVPTREQLRSAIEARVAELDTLIVRVPMTLKHAKSALARVNSELPPNGPNRQQFKDSLIWEALLVLGRNYAVHFVTEDGDFRASGTGGELAPVLREECEAQNIELHIHTKLADCLNAIRVEAPNLDSEAIALSLGDVVRDKVRDDAARYGLRVEGLGRYSVSSFATERHDVIAVDFKLVFELAEAASDLLEPRTSIYLTVEGSCSLPARGGEPLELNLGHLEFDWIEFTGLPQHFGIVFASGYGYLGWGPDVKHTVKYEIDQRDGQERLVTQRGSADIY